MSVTPADLIAAARSYAGTPFVYTGRSKWGVDCLGLLVLSAHDVGWLADFNFSNYGRFVDPEVVFEKFEQFCRELASDEAPQPGDVLLFKVVGNPQHVGLLTQIGSDGSRFFIHADQSVGRVLEARLAGRWANRLFKVYRPRYDELNARYLPAGDR